MRKRWITLFAAALILAGCGSAPAGGPAPATEAAAAETPPGDQAQAEEARPTNRIPLLEEDEDFSPERFAKSRPEPEGAWLKLDPVPERPGDAFAFTVEGVPADFERVTRGIDAYLECWDGTAWSLRYILFAGIGDGTPSYQVYGPVVVPAVGLGGPGPERLVLPDSLERPSPTCGSARDGSWRLRMLEAVSPRTGKAWLESTEVV